MALVIENLGVVWTMRGGEPSPLKGASILVEDGLIREIKEGSIKARGAEVIDAGGRAALPGLVDSHTHLVYAGERAWEFAERLRGASYLEILERGGGIHSTVRATREASEEELLALAERRLRVMLSWGVTTVEAKSGYGLLPEAEERQLRVINRLRERGWELVPTFLVHVVPLEYKERRDEYVSLVVNEMLPAFKNLARFADVFADQGAFTREEAKTILSEAKRLGYGVKLHADELADTGGASLAAELGAASADHLIRASEEGLWAMREAGVVPTLLPGTSFTLREPFAPVEKLRALGMGFAVASDHNPGTSPTLSLPAVAAVGVLGAGMTVEEALLGITYWGARALGLDDRGSLEPGKRADILILDAPSPEHLVYQWGTNLTWKVIRAGEVAWG